MPRERRHSRVGIWLGGLLFVLVGAGAWLAVDEGWPGKEIEQVSADAIADLTSGEDTSEADDTVALQTSGTQPTQAAQGTLPSTTTRPTAAPNATSSLASGDLSGTVPSSAPLNSGLQSAAQEVSTTSTEASTEASTPATANASTERLTTPPADVIAATFNADCWVELRFEDGRIEQGIYTPGQTLNIPVNEITRVTFGNVSAVQAMRGGEAFDLTAFARGNSSVVRISAQDLN